jgi:DNA-binding MarR family transcriptional regulator
MSSESDDEISAVAADYGRSLGGAAIGARLRRLSERIDRDANRIYAQLGITFEQRWMGVLDLIARRGPMSVNELAATLAISHPSVSQTRRSLTSAGFLAERPDPADGRRRILRLTAKGKALVEQLSPVWAALEAAGHQINAEAQDAVSSLDRLDEALDRRSLFERVTDRAAPWPAAKRR